MHITHCSQVLQSACRRGFPCSFLIGCLAGVLATVIWLMSAEPWEILADGQYYMMLYEGNPAPAPFGYRVLTPLMASLLPCDARTAFGIVTAACLTIASGIIALYLAESGFRETCVGLFMWLTSFAFIYYATTYVRADAPMLLMIALFFLLSKKHVHYLFLAAVLAIGCLAHETMLICLPILWIDKLLPAGLTGARHYKYSQLIAISLGVTLVLFASRTLIPVLPARQSYMTGIGGMISYTLAHSGGWMKRVLRIYASYGPALLYAITYLVSCRSLRQSWHFWAILSLASGATFLATDTLRVMALIYFPVIVYATKHIAELWSLGRRLAAWVCIALQACYSFIVYGHLRTFENSFGWNLTAALVSCVALVVCLYGLVREGGKVGSPDLAGSS